MPKPRIRSAIRSLALLLMLTPLAVSGPAAAVAVYPTDRCVSQKLRAAAEACQTLLDQRTHGAASAKRLAAAASRLGQRWSAAERQAAKQGVDCAETTVGSDEMFELLQQGAEDLAGEAGAPACRERSLRNAGAACAALLRAEARHLAHRARDRERRWLHGARVRALQSLVGGRPAAGRCADRSEAALAEGVGALAGRALAAVTVSPRVAESWTMITPEEEVTYQGRSLRPICSGGTPYVYFVKRGSVNKLLVYYQGGGACWDFFTCSLPTFKTATGPGDDPATFAARAPNSFADPIPENPFRDWHQVFVPYCTGDVHWGDATFVHEAGDNAIVIEHRGYVNAQVVEKWTREHFVHPDQVFVTGSSAGAYGAIVNSLPLQEFVYPSADFAVLGDAGNGVITQEFLVNDLAKWGIEKNLPAWIPGLNRPLAELDAADLWSISAEFYPQNRFATYTTAFDGSLGGQTGFFNIMRNPDDLGAWLSWWNASCDWSAEMRALNAKAASLASNYRFYVGAGSRHVMWNSDKVYADRSGGESMTIADWVRAMIRGSPAWVNVSCTDCGRLLPGDPAPSPPQPPFVADPGSGEVSIVCEE